MKPGYRKNSAPCIANMLIVWVAPHPVLHETVVVGWYENSTLYRSRQYLVTQERLLPNGNYAHYFGASHKNDCGLIPVENRNFVIPRGEGGIGESNIYYAKDNYTLKQQVIGYLKNWASNPLSKV
jgi:hypothetical protein